MRPTIRDVARLAGTSVAAVSCVVNGAKSTTIRTSPATRARILAAAAQLGFQPNPVAQSLVTRRTHVIGIGFPYVASFYDCNPFNAQMLSGLVEGARLRKQDLMLHTTSAQPGGEPDTESLVDRRADGLALILPARNSPVVPRCRETGFPLVAVVFDREWGAPYTVNCDDFLGAQLAARHFLGLGHRKIAHIIGDPAISSTAQRLHGYRAALAEAGTEARPEWEVPGAFTIHAGEAGVGALLALPTGYRPTAIFAANDLIAEGVLRACRTHGVRVPDDLALVGYDDTWFAAERDPALTSVHMPIYSMGVAAINLLLAQIQSEPIEEPHVVLPPTLTIRESCGAPPTAG